MFERDFRSKQRRKKLMKYLSCTPLEKLLLLVLFAFELPMLLLLRLLKELSKIPKIIHPNSLYPQIQQIPFNGLIH